MTDPHNDPQFEQVKRTVTTAQVFALRAQDRMLRIRDQTREMRALLPGRTRVEPPGSATGGAGNEPPPVDAPEKRE